MMVLKDNILMNTDLLEKVLCTRVSGQEARKMELEFNYGQMDQSTKEYGKMVKLRVGVE